MASTTHDEEAVCPALVPIEDTFVDVTLESVNRVEDADDDWETEEEDEEPVSRHGEDANGSSDDEYDEDENNMSIRKKGGGFMLPSIASVMHMFGTSIGTDEGWATTDEDDDDNEDEHNQHNDSFNDNIDDNIPEQHSKESTSNTNTISKDTVAPPSPPPPPPSPPRIAVSTSIPTTVTLNPPNTSVSTTSNHQVVATPSISPTTPSETPASTPLKRKTSGGKHERKRSGGKHNLDSFVGVDAVSMSETWEASLAKGIPSTKAHLHPADSWIVLHVLIHLIHVGLQTPSSVRDSRMNAWPSLSLIELFQQKMNPTTARNLIDAAFQLWDQADWNTDIDANATIQSQLLKWATTAKGHLGSMCTTVGPKLDRVIQYDCSRWSRDRVSGEFYVCRIADSGTMCVDVHDLTKVYEVVGICQPLGKNFDLHSLPVVARLILLPFDGRIVHDGFPTFVSTVDDVQLRTRLNVTTTTFENIGSVITSFPSSDPNYIEPLSIDSDSNNINNDSIIMDMRADSDSEYTDDDEDDNNTHLDTHDNVAKIQSSELQTTIGASAAPHRDTHDIDGQHRVEGIEEESSCIIM